MSRQKDLKKQLQTILEKKSIIRGPITLSSGKKSSYYIDCKQTSLDRDGIVLIAQLLRKELEGIDAIGGPTLGADPFLGAILYDSWLQKKELSAFIVRKKSKQHGTQKMIEGPLQPKMKVAIIEDVITTGGSIQQAIQTVEEFGAKVVKVIVLVDREEGGTKSLEQEGYPVVALFKKRDLNL